jgi:hypothetical protein
MAQVWVLMKDEQPFAVYDDWNALLRRLDRIAAANPQYPLRTTGSSSWAIGPEDEEEGFFGNRRVHLRAVETPYYPDVVADR